jgi:plastocyanin
MTNTPTEEREAPATDDATPVTAAAGAPVAADAEPTPFWQRPYVERYLVPLVLPVAVVVGLVAYILNISRLFLSGHGHIPIGVGSAILLLILIGATMLAAVSPRLKHSSSTLVPVGFIVLIMASGWLVLGHSQPEATGPTTLPDTLKTTQTLKVTAAPASKFAFAPNALTAKTGLATIDVNVGAPGHNFSFHQPETLFEPLDLAGSEDKGVAFFPKAGTYTFFCAVPGHEAQGMKGTVTVTGPTVTLDQALKAAGNPAGAAG